MKVNVPTNYTRKSKVTFQVTYKTQIVELLFKCLFYQHLFLLEVRKSEYEKHYLFQSPPHV
jgi:hypothetical protein